MLLATIDDCMEAAANEALPEPMLWISPEHLEEIRAHFMGSSVATALVAKMSSYSSQNGAAMAPGSDSEEITPAIDEDECVSLISEIEKADLYKLEADTRLTLLDLTVLTARGAMSGGLVSVKG